MVNTYLKGVACNVPLDTLNSTHKYEHEHISIPCVVPSSLYICNQFGRNDDCVERSRDESHKIVPLSRWTVSLRLDWKYAFVGWFVGWLVSWLVCWQSLPCCARVLLSNSPPVHTWSGLPSSLLYCSYMWPSSPHNNRLLRPHIYALSLSLPGHCYSLFRFFSFSSSS